MSSHSPRDTGAMSVEDENRRNSETDDLHTVLDSFMQAREETLEELVGGFMYLTMDDVRRSNTTTTVRPSSPSADSVFMAEDAETALTAAASVLNSAPAPGHNSVKGEGGGKRGVGRQTEEIEEEVLEDGADGTHASEDALFRHRPASLTKFDNFLLAEEEAGSDGGKDSQGEDGEGEEEDWMPTSGYMASFSAGNAASEEAPSQHSGSTPGMEEAEITPQNPPEVIGAPPHQHGSSRHSSAATTLDARRTSSTDGDGTDDAAAITLDARRTSSTDGDGTDDAAATSPTDCDVHSSVCEEEVEAPAWALNPGEAEEDEEVDPHQALVKPRLSVIEISTVKGTSPASVADGEGSAGLGDPDVDCNDEVLPFELEEGYDYETVVYTPKFTPAEMNYLKSFVNQNS